MIHLVFIVLFFISCSGNDDPTPSSVKNMFVKGADVSWLPQMEASGFKFYNSNGKETDCLDILKENGLNTIRLRVFVNPSNDPISGHCSPAETVAMAKRAKQKGFKLMIDFHYSDTWADPGHQTKPEAWKEIPFDALKDSVYQHTYSLLKNLKEENASPKWVQLGNEIPSGMLWPDGHSDNFRQLTELINSGFAATKAVDSQIQTIVHIDQGNNKERFKWFFDLAAQHGMNYDIIGASYYPYWLKSDYTETILDLEENLKFLVNRFSKPVMLVEVGGESVKSDNTYKLIRATINAVRTVPSNQGLGVLYWEPEGAQIWSHYKLSCWQDNGRPSPALNAFLD